MKPDGAVSVSEIGRNNTPPLRQKILVLHAAHYSPQTQRIVSLDINAVATHDRSRESEDNYGFEPW